MSGMNRSTYPRRNQRGEINSLAIPLILMVLLFFGAAAFGYWAYTGRQDYKNNVDQKIAAAVELAKRDEGIKKDMLFAEEYKKPLQPYDGPAAYGSIHLDYPKTWSVYINSGVTNPQPLDAYLNPKTVPSTSDTNSVFALRVKVLQQQYASVVKSLESNIKAKKITAAPYSLPKVPESVGIRVDGLIVSGKKITGSMVILPLRDKTIEIWTEDAQQLNDFNNTILPNMTFSP